MPDKIYNTVKKGKNVSDTVYNILHANIVNLSLTPGTLMSEKDISERMSVSRTPVREAFIRLSNEALVTVRPQKGTFVSKIDLDRVEEERFLRESLELSVMGAFFEFHSEQAFDRLERNLEKQKLALENNELIKFIEYDDQFHSIFFDEAKKRMCYGVLRSFSSHYRRVRFLSMSIAGVSAMNVDHHSDIIESVKRNNLEEARDILKTHLRKLIVEEDEIMEKYSEYFEMSKRTIADPDIFSDFGKPFNS